MIYRGFLIALLLAGTCAAMPRAGSTAPPLSLSDLDGKAFENDTLRQRPTVLVFGELYHHATRDAWTQIDQILKSPTFSAHDATPLLIVAQDATAAELKKQLATLPPTGLVLHDPKRRAFGDYQVTVMPTVVVLDAGGKVIHSLPGMTPRFADTLRDALLVAGGRLSPERFQETLHPQEKPVSEERVRANRLAQLANQLARRGLDEMAQEQYAQALALAPDHADARMGLGRLFLKRGRIADAETQFRALLASDARVVDASVGLAFVHYRRGGDELAEARRIVRDVLETHPGEARAHFLMGLIHEQGELHADAAASFKRAAELLIERYGDAE